MNHRVLVGVLLLLPLSASGAAHDPAWSSGDAARLAYYANPGGNFDIHVRGPDGDIGIPMKHPAYDGSPQWRPRHEQWSFMSDRGGSWQLYLLNAEDGSVEPLTDEAGDITNHAWSANGKLLAYEKRLEGNSDIWLLDTGTGESRRLTGDAAADFDPDFSPDGGQLVFQSNRGGSYQLYLLDLDSSGVSALPAFEGHATGPFWASDGQIYLSRVQGKASTLVALDPASGESRTIARFDLPTLKPAVNPAGNRVALFQMDPASGGSQIIVVSLPDGEVIERFGG